MYILRRPRRLQLVKFKCKFSLAFAYARGNDKVWSNFRPLRYRTLPRLQNHGIATAKLPIKKEDLGGTHSKVIGALELAFAKLATVKEKRTFDHVYCVVFCFDILAINNDNRCHGLRCQHVFPYTVAR